MKKLKVSKATDQREGHIIKTSKLCPWSMVCITQIRLSPLLSKLNGEVKLKNKLSPLSRTESINSKNWSSNSHHTIPVSNTEPTIVDKEVRSPSYSDPCW